MTAPALPTNVDELRRCLADPMWRICSGALYKIMVKGDDEEDESDIKVMPFIPNDAQLKLYQRIWYRNIVLKARQRGFTTAICILWLDTALFCRDMRCGIVAHNEKAAGGIFRDKVRFAYDNLPPALKAAMPLKRDSAEELLFGHNNSSIQVATSLRSGTFHRVHVSEFGKICAKYPDKANEVVTGSIPSVPRTGIVVIESTAEGQDGDFYKMTARARAKADAGQKLTKRDYRFHFSPWWDDPNYRMSPQGVIITDKDRQYFESVEAKMNTVLTDNQRAWYIATRDEDFSGDESKMWAEYPSTPDEAFQQSTEGCWFTVQMTAARKAGRIGDYPLLPNIPCNTFWDIGNSDGTAIWVHQRVGQKDHFVRFYEQWGEPYATAVKWLQELGVVFDTHYLPHDATHERQGMEVNESPKQMLEKLMPRHRFEIVERTHDLVFAIAQTTRAAFATACFDQTHCKEGIAHLDNYKKTWNRQTSTWQDIPYKLDGHSEAADAFRQFAQGYQPHRATQKLNRRWNGRPR